MTLIGDFGLLELVGQADSLSKSRSIPFCEVQKGHIIMFNDQPCEVTNSPRQPPSTGKCNPYFTLNAVEIFSSVVRTPCQLPEDEVTLVERQKFELVGSRVLHSQCDITFRV